MRNIASAYSEAVEALYSVSYALKFTSKKTEAAKLKTILRQPVKPR